MVALVGDEAVLVEAHEGDAGHRHLVAGLLPAGPPLDGGPLAGCDRLSEPALDVLLDREVLLQVGAHAGPASVGLAERQRPITDLFGIEGDDCLDVLGRPGLAPDGGPSPGGIVGVHRRDGTKASCPSAEAASPLGTLDARPLPGFHGRLVVPVDGSRPEKRGGVGSCPENGRWGGQLPENGPWDRAPGSGGCLVEEAADGRC